MLKKNIGIYLLFLLVPARAVSQNVSSPYSILGIGDIENNDYGRYDGSGNATVSRRDPWAYNASNPASLTAILYKTMNFDFSFRGKVSRFRLVSADTLTQPTKDFVIKRVSLAFKLTPKTGIAFGLKPFSSMNYQFTTGASVNNGDEVDYEKYVEGTGGINQVYFSIGKEIIPRLSAGVTASWQFGSLQNSIQYYSSGIGLDITKKQTDFYSGAGVKAGLQYYSLPGKRWQHTAGLTFTAYSNLKGERTVDYQESEVSIKTLPAENISFKMPMIASAGYSIANRKGLSFNLQGNYQSWATQKLDYRNTYIKDAYSVHAGMEYSKQVRSSNTMKELYYLALGVRYEQSYIVINNNHLNDYGISIGGGKNVSRFLSLQASLGIGRRGSHSLQQIQEDYYQFSAGLTLKDFWFGTKKMGRFR